jgi:hypothetical protein
MGVTGGARFTIRSILITVALVGLNLAAAIETWNNRPPQQTVGVGLGPRLWPSHNQDHDGNLRVDLETLTKR